MKRTVRRLELVDDPDPERFRDIDERRAELLSDRDRLQAQLDTARARVRTAPNPDLIDATPVGTIDIAQLPDELARDLFEALGLEIHYNKQTSQACCRITLTGPTINAAVRTARQANWTRTPATDTTASRRKIRVLTNPVLSLWRPRQDSNLRPRD